MTVYERARAFVEDVLEKKVLRLEKMKWSRARGIALRTLFLFAAAVTLFTVCRNGQSTVVVGVAFAVYVAAAAIWVRGQYTTSLTGELWTPPILTSFLATTLFAGCLVGGVVWNNGSLLITGLVAGFFSLGYLAMAVRKSPKDEATATQAAPTTTEATRRTGWRKIVAAPSGLPRLINRFRKWLLRRITEARRGLRLWIGALAILTALAVVGIALLGTDTRWRWLLAAAILIPIPISVLSDRLIAAVNGEDRKVSDPWERWGRWMVPVGAALALTGIIAAALQVRGPWMGVVIVVLTLLVFALVSSTYADIAIIVAIIALLGITPQQQAPAPELDSDNTEVLVALGDSYMSGEGANSYYAGTDNDGNHCRRSPTAWAELAGQRDEFNGFISFACSGARTFNVNSEKADGGIEPVGQFSNIGPQLDDYATQQEKLGFQPKLVVVSLGGNDAGFSTIGAMCLAPGDCGEKGDTLWIPNLPTVERQLRATYAQISAEFDDVPVAVVGYPDPIYSPVGLRPNSLDEPDCGRVPLSFEDRTFIEHLLDELNKTVQRAAEDAGFYYVEEMADSLANARLQLCDPANDNRPGLNIIGLQSVTGVAEDRFNPKNWYHNSLHPNERGHAALLTAFETWLDANPELFEDDHIRDPAASAGSAAPAESQDDELCVLYEVDDHDGPTCEAEGYNWVGAQISEALLGMWGLIYLAIAGGAWLLAVSFFAWRKRVAQRELHDDLVEIAALGAEDRE